MGNFRDFKNSFPEDSHSKGKAFERFLAGWFFKNHPLYRHKFEKVWLWEDWPKPKGVAAQDLGTDLIARDTEGKICAIQAKFYDVDSHIKFKDISTFLADSSKDYIDHRLLIGTAELAPNARKQLNSQEKPVSTFLLHDFEAWDFAWPKSLASLAKAKLQKPHEARPHQRAAIKDVCAKLDGRGQLIMACGTGKTLTGQRIAEKLDSETTLVLLPSLLLLSGTMNDWLKQTKVGFHYLPVCSDASIGGKAAPETNFTSGELGNASTTDPKEIRKFLRQKGNKVIFSTYQSSGRVADALKGTRIKFDLILADEAHRCAGKVAADYGFVLDAKKLPAKNRLFMTATPRIYKSNIKKAAKDADIQIASMDDETVFGPVVHHLTFGKAIEDKLLTDYQVVVVGVNDTAVGEMVDERALVKTEAGLERDAQTLGSQLGLMKAVKKYDLQRVITFHSRINQARDYASEFLEVMDATKKKDKPSGTITYSHVSGAMPTSERNNKLKALGLLEYQDRYLLGNARCLSEGVDVPALDGVAFVDPRRSEIDIIQAVGRAIRKSSSKTKGTIIIPVFIEEGDDPDLVLSTSAFDQVWKVVNALRAHDEKLGEELDGIRRAIGRGDRASFHSSKLIFDIPSSVGDAFVEAFETKLVELTTQSWEFWYGLLESYVSEFGNCHVHGNYKTARGFNLGAWVSTERLRYGNGKLPPEKVDRLNAIGFIWDALEHRWREAVEALKRYVEEHGDCLVPAKYVDDSGFKLGGWVGGRRKNREKLSAEKLRELNEIGFVWDPLNDAWLKALESLEKYSAHYGHCLVPQRYVDESGVRLGQWLGDQRKHRHQLSPERLKLLEGVGFVWNAVEEAWRRGFASLKRYYDTHGNCRVVYSYIDDEGFNLGKWVQHQRSLKSRLDSAQLHQLDSIGFIWDVEAHTWQTAIDSLKRFIEENDHASPTQDYIDRDGFNLGRWINDLRQRKSRLSADQRQRLAEVGMIWDPYEEKWQKGFQALKKYYSETGDCSPAARFVDKDGYALGRWVASQRKYKAKLSSERQEALDELGFIWDPLEERWQQAFEALKTYRASNGDCLVPAAYIDDSGFKLGSWVANHRTYYLHGKLPEDRVQLLNSVDFIWDAPEYAWLQGVAALTVYCKQFGNCRVIDSYVDETGFKLGQWVLLIRTRRKKHLTPDQINQLNALGFIWDVAGYDWGLGLASLEKYRNAHGDCVVVQRYVDDDGYRLGHWVGAQRKNVSKLTTEQIDSLDKLGFIWRI